MILTEEQKRRYRAFWNREKTDRACIFMGVWDGAPGSPKASSLEEQWEDLDFREKQMLYRAEHTKYYAEGFPSVFTNFGPGSLAACIGGSYSLSPDTIWFENKPFFIEDFENYPKPTLDKNSKMYRMIDEMTARLLRHSDKIIPSISDIGGTYDIIASLRGTENLLYDLYDSPDEVLALRDEIAPLWKQVFLEDSRRLIEAQGCMNSWMNIWSDTSYFTLQCDFSAMISPDMFAKFILPDLREQTEFMDRSIYHLDGIGELPHLDQILSLPRLCAIQWSPGAGKPRLADPCWYEMYRRIIDAGKGLILQGIRPEELESILKNVSQRGMYIEMCRVRDEEDANDIISMAKKLYF